MELHRVLHMKGGEDEASYAKNSAGQGLIIMTTKHLLEESIKELCRSNLPDTLRIADLGCSSGPNTFSAVKIILESIKKEYCSKSSDDHKLPLPSFQVFLNDLFSNDFNTVFNSLPNFYGELERKGLQSGSCLVAAMPGSFYERLFPENSMHFIHSSNSLHWLSKAPDELVTEMGSPLNKRNICIAKSSPPEVHDAYLEQFQKDFTNFLRLRSIEMASHGQLFLNFLSNSHDNDDFYSNQEILGMTLYDMVIEGLIEETKLATFNLPVYEPSKEEVRHIIEREGSFRIMHLEVIRFGITDGNGLPNSFKEIIFNGNTLGESAARIMRAALGPILASHFGEAIIHDLFSRFSKRVLDYLGRMESSCHILAISLAKK